MATSDVSLDPWLVAQVEAINMKLDQLTQYMLSTWATYDLDPSLAACEQKASEVDAKERKYGTPREGPDAPQRRRVEFRSVQMACTGGEFDKVARMDSGDSDSSRVTVVSSAPVPPEDAFIRLSQGELRPVETMIANPCSTQQPALEPCYVRGNDSCCSDQMRMADSIMSIRASDVMAQLGKSRRRSHLAEGAWMFLEMPQSSRWAMMYVSFFRLFVLGTIFVTFCQAFEVWWFKRSHAVVVESCIDAYFFLEGLVRAVSCPSLSTYLLSPHTVIDVLAAAPLVIRAALSFQPLPGEGEKRMLRALFLGFVPVLRLLKTLRHSRKFHLLTKAFLLAFEALPVLLFFYSVLALLFSTLLYAIEPPENLPDFHHAVWLTVVSMTTVGYGDFTPVSALGRFTVAVLVVSSGLYMAIPLGILGSCFSQVWHNRDRHLLGYCIQGALQQHGFTLSDLPVLFENFDKDGDGSLNFFEFHNMVQKLRLDLSDERLMDLYENVDQDQSGSINVEEFIKFLSPSVRWQAYSKVGERFRMFSATVTSRSYSSRESA